MQIFRIDKTVRNIGLNYGVACISITYGIGVGYGEEDLIKKLVGVGLREGTLVVMKKNTGLLGMGLLVKALRYLNVKVEMETDGDSMTPGWFPEVTFWLVRWVPGGRFNYKALRPRQDLIVCKDNELEKFLQDTKGTPVERGIISDKEVPIDLLYTHNLRLYRTGESE